MQETRTLATDQIERSQFVDRLIQYVVAVGESDVLPAGRVVAVNGPWGTGKSWVAQKLAADLHTYQQVGRAGIYINAFQFDFHQDPFPVLASAILDALPGGSGRSELKLAAGKVLKASLPGLAKGLVKTASKQLIGEDGIDALEEALGNASEKALESLLDTYKQTHESAEAFKKELEKAAHAASGPLVVVVDELDRCKPTFALQLLERIKHLFDVPNVVFVLFFHAEAMTSAIGHSYGTSLDARAYLRKFISLNIDLPHSLATAHDEEARADLFRSFLSPQIERTKVQEHREVLLAIALLAPRFSATLRDVQASVMLANILGRRARAEGGISAYVLLLRVTHPQRVKGLRERNKDDCGLELERLSFTSTDPAWLTLLAQGLSVMARPELANSLKPDTMAKVQHVHQSLDRAIKMTDLEYLRL